MKKLLFIVLFSSFLIAKEQLLFYCGITMVKPMTEISKIIEKKDNVKIEIIQGGSGDLYDSLSSAKKGDIYLPGSNSYIKKHLKDGFFGYRKYIGFNQIAIFVQPHNPKKVVSLKDLLRPDLAISLGNAETCSMGKETLKVLKSFGGEKFLDNVEDNLLLYSADSRDFNQLLKTKQIDMGLNWRATAFFPQNRGKMIVIKIDEKYAPKKKLILTMLTFSKHKKVVKDFIDFTISKNGQKIMKEYGFLDE